jgi:hypothetical protein
MLRTRGFVLLTVMVGASIVAPACSKDEGDRGFLSGKDLERPVDVEQRFDRNNLVDPAAFTDVDGIDVTLIEKFLHRTPYDTTSFLETYQSNGVSAADAIARASRTYRINPLVFLVSAETSQGLVAAQQYPFPPERVEYVFGCGCLQPGNCQAQLAGFDRQVDCLGRAFRVALDTIAKNGVTASGWGPDKVSTTLDNLKVTPANDATAAIYDRTPRVAENGAGGTWLFWNVWNLYAAGIDYAGPIGAGGGAWIGDACASTTQCGFENATCATNYPGGLCTTACTGDCPSQPDRPEAFCADFGKEGGFCFQVCNLGAPACRQGYKCLRVAKYKNAAQSSPVCFPDSTSR